MSPASDGIFVTVGAQMPFDRLIRGVDAWAGAQPGRASRVFAQIGPGSWKPNHVAHVEFLGPEAFRARVSGARAVVAHAGMGSILTALELGKPILVMPRRGALRETRNDHQVATAERLLERGMVSVAWDESELPAGLDALERATPAERIGATASDRLIRAVREFILRAPPGSPQTPLPLTESSVGAAPAAESPRIFRGEGP